MTEEESPYDWTSINFISGVDDVLEWIETDADGRELNLILESVTKKQQRLNLEKANADGKRAVFVTVRIERTDKISDLLNYLLSHELEFEAEE